MSAIEFAEGGVAYPRQAIACMVLSLISREPHLPRPHQGLLPAAATVRKAMSETLASPFHSYPQRKPPLATLQSRHATFADCLRGVFPSSQ